MKSSQPWISLSFVALLLIALPFATAVRGQDGPQIKGSEQEKAEQKEKQSKENKEKQDTKSESEKSDDQKSEKSATKKSDDKKSDDKKADATSKEPNRPDKVESKDDPGKDGAPTPAQPIEFESSIKPILIEKCSACHDPDNSEGKIDFSDPKTWRHTVESGEPNDSLLYEVITLDIDDDMHMPPADEDQLKPDEIALIKAWIEQGGKLSLDEPAADNGEDQAAKTNEPIWMRIWQFVGVFHPAMVHFPIALYTVALIFILFFRKKTELSNEGAFYLLILGTLGAVVAATVGWSFASIERYNVPIDDMDHEINWHRWSGIACAVVGVIVSLIAWRQRSQPYSDGGGSWKWGVVVLALMVGLVGHQGGDLTYPELYEKNLKKYLPEADEQINKYMPGLLEGEKKPAPAKVDENNDPVEPTAAKQEKSAKTS